MTKLACSRPGRGRFGLLVAAVLAIALATFLAPQAHADLTQLSDGSYEVPVTLSGGSGRASVATPAKVVVNGGETTATIVWSSSNYDKMTVDGKDYAPTTTDGGSTFDIPVTDDEMKVKAETTAMDTPHTIDYTLSFDVGSAQETGGSGGGVSMGAVVGVIAALLVVGIVIGVVSGRRKARR